MAIDDLQIVERDGDVVRVVGSGIEFICKMYRVGDQLILDQFSMDGAGRGSLGLANVRRLAREFAAGHRAKTVIIRGTTRTTGARPGKMPREIVISVV